MGTRPCSGFRSNRLSPVRMAKVATPQIIKGLLKPRFPEPAYHRLSEDDVMRGAFGK